jgi:hypothetical protein
MPAALAFLGMPFASSYGTSPPYPFRDGPTEVPLAHLGHCQGQGSSPLPTGKFVEDGNGTLSPAGAWSPHHLIYERMEKKKQSSPVFYKN